MSVSQTVTWDTARAGGFVAYVLLVGSIALGLALSLRWRAPGGHAGRRTISIVMSLSWHSPSPGCTPWQSGSTRSWRSGSMRSWCPVPATTAPSGGRSVSSQRTSWPRSG